MARKVSRQRRQEIERQYQRQAQAASEPNAGGPDRPAPADGRSARTTQQRWLWPVLGCLSLPFVVLGIVLIAGLFSALESDRRTRAQPAEKEVNLFEEFLDAWAARQVAPLLEDAEAFKWDFERYQEPLIRDIPLATRKQIAVELEACTRGARIVADTKVSATYSDLWWEVKETVERDGFVEIAGRRGITLEQAYAIQAQSWIEGW